jgi:hypothetical protein
MKTDLSKLLAKYHRASAELAAERNKCFPAGARVRSKLTGLTATVITGSIYPDQVRTTIGHLNPHFLELINEN